MNDTPDSVARRYRELLMRCTGAERLRMGCAMFDAARALVRAGAAANGETAVRAAVFLRTYGSDFDAETRMRIVRALGG